MTSGKGAFGTILKVGDGGGTEVFTAIAEIIGDLAGPNITQDTIEMTNHSSTSASREYLAGLNDAGEVSFEFNYIDGNTQQELLRTLATSRAARNFQLLWPDTSQAAFSAIVTALSRSAPVDGALRAACTLKISGVVTWS